MSKQYAMAQAHFFLILVASKGIDPDLMCSVG